MWLPAYAGDVVLRRADGFVAYHLATAVDELAMGITQVFRGDDLLPATAVQVALMEELGGTPPSYWHAPLLLDEDGQRLAKRRNSAGLDPLRQAGWDAATVVGTLAGSLGLVPTGQRLSATELLADLSLVRLEEACRRPAAQAMSGIDIASCLQQGDNGSPS